MRGFLPQRLIPMSLPFVLSIDWDFFVGDSSVEPCKVCRWNCGGPEKPAVEKRKEQTYQDSHFDFQVVQDPTSHRVMQQFDWLRWNGVPLVVADCHASLYRLLPPHAYIYNVDHHMDSDPALWDTPNQPLTCGSWGTLAVANKDCHYEWCHSIDLQPDGKSIALVESPYCWHRPEFVFLCLSSPYVNPAYDDYFYRLVFTLSQRMAVNPEFVGLGARGMCRAYRRLLVRQKQLALEF